VRRILLLISGLLIFLALAVPTAAVYYLAFTESGFRFLIERVPHKVGDVQLDIAGASGTLAHGIKIERLDIDHHLVHLRFEGIAGRVELIPILLQTIRTQNAFIRSVHVQTKRRTRPPTASQPQFLPRWLIVSFDHARLGSSALDVPNGTHLEATDMYASGVARYRTIRFFEAGLQTGSTTRIDGAGELRAADPLRLDVQTRIGWMPAGQPAWNFTATAKGDLNALVLTIHTITPFRSDFTGRALDLASRWHWVGDAVLHDFDVTAWGGSRYLGLMSGQLALQGNSDGFSARGPVTPAGLKVGIFDALFTGSYSNRMVRATHMEITHRSSGAHAEGEGTIEVVKDGPRLDLRGNWRDFRWPLIGKDLPVHSAQGQFTVGGVWPYSVHADGVANVGELPQMPARIDGSLAKDRFSFNTAEVDLYEGHASVSGAVIWQPPQSWSVAGRITDINPAQFRSDLPGRISFTLAASGAGLDPKAHFSADFRDLGGRLRGVPASGGGRLARDGSAWRFDTVRVALGRTSLALDGRLSEQLDLRFAVAAQDLSLIAPDSRGQLQASGTVHGSPSDLAILAKARGSSIQHDGLGVEAFEADIDFDPDPQHVSHVDARLKNLAYHDRSLESLAFKLDGKAASYQINLDAKGLGLAVTAQASGPLTNAAWHGQLNALTITGTESLHLTLERPVGLFVARDQVRAEWMCLVGQPASLCADGEWSPKGWDATVTAHETPLAAFTTGLTHSVEYGGRVNMRARLFGGGEDPVQGSARVDLIDASLTHRLTSGRIEHTSIGSGLVTLNAARSVISVDVGLESGEVGTIKGRLTAQRGADRWQSLPIQGELHAHTEQLGLITLYVPDIDRAAGHLDADMQVAGTLGTPLVNGELKLSGAEIDYYQVNLAMRQLAFDARLTDNGLDFGGSTRIGSGTATARGHLEWENSLPHGKFQLEGANLRVVDVPEAQIDASPALDFNINGRRIEVAGAVKVPYAKIVPKDLTGAARSSSDEVVVGKTETDPSKRFEVVSAITMSLGDRVSVDTTGLTGRLKGNITVRSGYDAVTSATGELSIEEGKYTAYARKLDIQRGRLIFTGGPVGNPGIDIRAIKVFPDVTAGVNVRGTLLQPRMSFFSDPSLTQSQIVSLILAGGSLETAQNRQQGAGNELLAQGGAILAQQLGSRVGIQDVSLESDLTNDTSLVLGRYLSPRLYVSYGVSLTQQLNVFKLRYSLGDHWTIKTEAGQARGADLVFTIEK